MQQHTEPMFPSLGSTMGGVASHNYIMSNDATPSTTGASLAPPMTYISFPHGNTAAAASANQMQAGMLDEVRTIFVTGFPDNVHERELHNLCRFIPGYEASQVAFKPNQQPQVFVLFTTPAHARQAMDALAGLPFDVQMSAPRSDGRHGDNSATNSSSSVSTAAGIGPRPVGNAPAGSEQQSPSGQAQDLLPNQASAGGDLSLAPAGPVTANGTPSGAASHLANFVSNRTALLSPSAMAGNVNPLTNGNNPAQSVPLPTPVKYHLRCEMAHKNLYIKDGDPSVRQPHRRIMLYNNPGVQGPQAGVAGLNNAGAVAHLVGHGNNGGAAGGNGVYAMHDLPVYGGGSAAATPSAVTQAVSVHPLASNAAGLPQPMGVPHQQMPLGTPLGFLPVTNRGDNPPCNTLFIGNLSDQVSELELLHLLSSQPGYKQLKLVRGPRQVSCFVEFEDTVTATAVHNSYQGAVLASSDRGGIRIQYSKNPFGKRSSIPGSNTSSVLRGAVGLQGSGDLSSAVAAAGGNWPMVAYHAVQQPQASMAYY